MQNIKNILFLYLTPRQKSQLLGTLKAYYQKFSHLGVLDIIDKFIEDEKYYIEINNPHFEFLKDYFEDDLFFREMEKYLNFLFYQDEQKKKIEPYLEKQKEYAKQMRKKAQEFKMSKLKPTKKQLYFYDKITKAHGIEKKDVENASRLDLRNWIMEIIEPQEENVQDE